MDLKEKAKQILLEASRQHRGNHSDKLIPAYEYEETQSVVVGLLAQHKAFREKVNKFIKQVYECKCEPDKLIIHVENIKRELSALSDQEV